MGYTRGIKQKVRFHLLIHKQILPTASVGKLCVGRMGSNMDGPFYYLCFQKMLSPSYMMLRIQRLECICRSRSTLFANPAIFVSGS